VRACAAPILPNVLPIRARWALRERLPVGKAADPQEGIDLLEHGAPPGGGKRSTLFDRSRNPAVFGEYGRSHRLSHQFRFAIG